MAYASMRRAVAACLLFVQAPAQALFIDFETTPLRVVPVDDAALSRFATFTDGLTEVSFGFDTNGDLIADVDAAYEARGGAPGGEARAAYITGDGSGGIGENDGPNDADFSTEFDGGDWLLRDPGGLGVAMPGDFVIRYGGAMGTRNAAGQIWDLDAGESWIVTAFAGDLATAIDTQTISGGSPLCCSGPDGGAGQGDGRPSGFAFMDATMDIAAIRIRLATGSRLTGFGFDNFNATGAQVPALVSTPGTLLLGLLGAGLGLGALRREGLPSR